MEPLGTVGGSLCCSDCAVLPRVRGELGTKRGPGCLKAGSPKVTGEVSTIVIVIVVICMILVLIIIIITSVISIDREWTPPACYASNFGYTPCTKASSSEVPGRGSPLAPPSP